MSKDKNEEKVKDITDELIEAVQLGGLLANAYRGCEKSKNILECDIARIIQEKSHEKNRAERAYNELATITRNILKESNQ